MADELLVRMEGIDKHFLGVHALDQLAISV
jgi:ABC-type sugar transport system ATPase subunit